MARIAGSKDEYQEKVINNHMGLIDLVQQYKSLKLTIDMLVQKCEMIRPRYYTIASSSVLDPRRLVIAVSVESFAAPSGERMGLVSQHL